MKLKVGQIWRRKKDSLADAVIVHIDTDNNVVTYVEHKRNDQLWTCYKSIETFTDYYRLLEFN